MASARARMGDRLFLWSNYFVAGMVAAVLLWILADMAWQGVQHLSWGFLTEEPAKSGRAGGIAPILWSTSLILSVAIASAVPLGLSAAVWLAEYSKQSGKVAGGIRLSLDVLAGVPSIVFGLFGNAFFCVYLGFGFSILSGGLTLACMILPIFIRTCERGLFAVNNDWRMAAAGLGMSRASVIWHVLLPAAAPAIVAGLMLGIGRATAETAALIFTSGYVDRMPESLMDSGRALSVHIFDLSMNVAGGDRAAYASALVLVVLIVLINVAAVALSDRWLTKRIATA
jgi:phosphate transport system permease protein